MARPASFRLPRRLGDELDVPVRWLRLALAIDFYAAYPDEIDERIAANERAARSSRAEIARRERLQRWR